MTVSEFEVVPLRLRHDKTAQLMRRFGRLPKWMQELIREDMETAFENRIVVMERIVKHGV
jgi:hypothetical protein